MQLIDEDQGYSESNQKAKSRFNRTKLKRRRQACSRRHWSTCSRTLAGPLAGPLAELHAEPEKGTETVHAVWATTEGCAPQFAETLVDSVSIQVCFCTIFHANSFPLMTK